jgi:hypothetical protein
MGCYHLQVKGCNAFAGDTLTREFALGEGEVLEHVEVVQVLPFDIARRACQGESYSAGPYRGEIYLLGRILRRKARS